MSIDDYLDLLNYAKQMNDEQWQADIIETLNNFRQISEEEQRAENVRELWSRFDEVNHLLLELFDKLRDGEDAEDSGRWKEQIWEMKLERITLSRQIQKQYIKII
ncbi:hypothetical protein C2I18_25315 [Paenibacillus sp. PK3_47]|uniref:hypothetical protein n=1 Tax=Paenibacillus sp. PK3_47 TaxID=2072642 RepID=UPI00201E409D|nr:hypothetical protein [Paenibacillus sp. PK3_47]UQZ36565.1 hypothetical protein C2I18_25315 [Paenibacillus sp. PK3_47]